MMRHSLSPLPRVVVRLSLVLPFSLIALAPLAAQQGVEADKALLARETYITPPAEVAKLVTAPREENSDLGQQSPDGRRFLATHGAGLGSTANFGKPHYYFGGLQVDYKANRARTLTTRGLAGIDIVDALTGKTVKVAVPQDASASSPAWSPDGSKLAFFANYDDATYLYVADASTGAAKRVGKRAALPVLSTTLDWAPDGSAVYVVLIPEARMPMPKEPSLSTGPLVRLTEPGTKKKTRTYASLLQSPYEKALLEYYATGQLARIDAKSGATRNVGAPAMISGVDVGPDGKYLRVTVMQKPFSYLVPVSSFGSAEQLWTTDGALVTTIATRELREGTGDDGPRTDADSGRRNIAWYPGGGIAFLMQDPAPKRGAGRGAARADSSEAGAGDSTRASRRKDRLYVWQAPFDAAGAKAIATSDNRVAGFVFTTDGKWAVLSENANGMAHTYALSLADPATRHTIYRARGAQVGFGRGFGGGGNRGGPSDDEFYNNPGQVVLRSGPGGQRALVSTDGASVYLEGTQYNRDPRAVAPRSFVDRVDLNSGAKSRLFESDTSVFESELTPVDADYAKMVLTRETEKVVPDQWLRDRASGALTKLTNNRDVTPAVTKLERRSYKVTRADGYTLWTDVTLPPGYRDGAKVPALFWFYPYEYTDQASYDRTKRTFNKHKFPAAGPRSMEIMATQGYAIVQPDAPIFGESGRMNDNYVPDLRNNLSAVIDELDRRGIIDRQRLGLGGHSYGAFSTVNAMVNTPFFKAGIAGDGNYNRTLTPTGFQSERRDLWDARETYLSMSPFLYADRLQGALLMYHSEEDQNTGTDPINSIRLFHALQSMGKPASLYMYPYEDHGPQMKDTLLDQWGRWVAWLDLYVKNAGTTAPGAGKVAENNQ